MLNLNCNAMAAPRRPLLRPLCSASSNTNSERLRTELDQLHAEAENTRSKGTVQSPLLKLCSGYCWQRLRLTTLIGIL